MCRLILHKSPTEIYYNDKNVFICCTVFKTLFKVIDVYVTVNLAPVCVLENQLSKTVQDRSIVNTVLLNMYGLSNGIISNDLECA